MVSPNDQEKENFKLLIPMIEYEKIVAYAKVCEDEITGFFDVEYSLERGGFLVTKVYKLLKQVAGAGDVEIDEPQIAEFNLELIKQGAEHLPRGWWHSHVNMTTFLSTTDEATLKALSNDSFVVAVVVNKDQEITAVAEISQPVPLRLDLDVKILYENAAQVEAAEKEVAKKVNAREVKHYFHNGKIDNTKYDDEKPNGFEGPAIRFLPKLKSKALRKIGRLQLVRIWDVDKRYYYYLNEDGTIKYLDFHGVITAEDYNSVVPPYQHGL